MKYFSLLLFTVLSNHLLAQNLIPNAAFEQNLHGKVLEWKQPLDDYYHYTLKVNETDSGTFYNAINGLCLLQPDPSEFMIAKLKRPLVKGQKYCASLNVYYNTTFAGTVKNVRSIDVAFSDSNIQVWKRRILYKEPRLKFPFTNPDGSFYQPSTIVFEAEGNEQYIILGKFHTPDEKFLQTMEERRTILWKELYYASDSIKKYYKTLIPVPSGNAISKKAIARETKQIADSTAKLEALKMEDIRACSQYYHQKVNELENQPQDTTIYHPPYHVRLYFDNICVTPVLATGECICDNDQPAFQVGQTYRLNNILFDRNESTFKPESYKEMDNLKGILTRYPKMQIQLNGHTDSLNSEKYNLDLSNQRAKAVYDYLVKKGISPKRLKWKGYGESEPVTENTTDEGRAINRRVEFIVLKND